MLKLSFPKNSAIQLLRGLVGFALCTNSAGILANSPPDGSGIKRLAIYSYDSSNQNTIYANGNMQAPVDIVYDLAEGYSFKNVTLKRLYTETPLTEWSITDKNNGYLHSISDIASKNSESSTQRGSVLRKYLSTKTANKALVCVELTASKAGSPDSIKSTCSGESQASNVHITALIPITITNRDVELTDWDSSTVIQTSYDVNNSKIRSLEIREQSLKIINSIFRIKNYKAQFSLDGSQKNVLQLRSALLSQYADHDRQGVGHIVSWVAHPNITDKIRFVDSVGINSHKGWVLEAKIPYIHSTEPRYVLSFITYKLRSNKDLVQPLEDDPVPVDGKLHGVCARQFDSAGKTKCQMWSLNLPLNQAAPEELAHRNQVNFWKKSKPSGYITLIDDYGTESVLNFSIRPTVSYPADYAVYIN